MDRKAIQDAAEFFEQSDESVYSYWDFNKSRKQDIAEALRALLARPEVAAVEKDAARYRWLRIDHGEREPFVGHYTGAFTRWTGKHADDLVDNAMREPQGSVQK